MSEQIVSLTYHRLSTGTEVTYLVELLPVPENAILARPSNQDGSPWFAEGEVNDGTN